MRLRILRKNNKGIAAVFLAVGMIALIGIVGLAVDIGYMYVAKGQLQNAADAAALAGAARLKASSDLMLFGNQSSARIAAQTFAGLNKAAGTPVQLDLNSTNVANGDIIIGNWDSTRPQNPTDQRFLPAEDGTLLPSGAILNAVKVIARRTGDQGITGIHDNTKVSLFFAKVLSPVWGTMAARSQAVAVRNQLATPALTVCIKSCGIAPGTQMDIQHDPKTIPIDNGLAWTSFQSSGSPDIGAKSDVVDIIWGRKSIQAMCDLCITTNNGVGSALGELSDAFNSTTYRAGDKLIQGGNVVSWQVAIPVLDVICGCIPDPTNPDSCTACPAGAQPNPEHVQQIAIVDIASVNTTSSTKGITVNSIHCIGCPTGIPFSAKGAHLVK